MFFGKTKNYLVADIGGTKSTLAIIDDKYLVKVKKVYLSAEITHFTETVNNFLKEPECKKYTVREASLAVAGPINENRTYAKLTNASWDVDVDDIIRHTPLQKVFLINDFEAVGFSVDTLKQEQYTELTNLGSNTAGTIVVIGAGTGLGVSILPYYKKKHVPLASEGGHVDLPILSDDSIDVKLESFLIKKKLYKSAEDVVSGRGIANIYSFLLTQKIKHSEKIRREIAKAKMTERPAMITRHALEGKDALCLMTVELFVKYYAKMARNLALSTLCTELVIAGGIAPKILSILQDMFVEEFTQHSIEDIRKIVERTSVIVLTDPDISLYGALNALNYS